MPTRASAAKRTLSAVAGRTISGTPKTKALKAKIRSAAQQVVENLKLRKAGRPTEYHPGFCHMAEQISIINATTANLADIFGTSDTSIEEWMRVHDEFARAIARGRARVDDRVEKSLAHRAIGYRHKSEKLFMTREGRVVRASINVQYPPDTKAAEVWLYNRRPGQWKARVDPAQGDDDVPAPVKVEVTMKDARKKRE